MHDSTAASEFIAIGRLMILMLFWYFAGGSSLVGTYKSSDLRELTFWEMQLLWSHEIDDPSWLSSYLNHAPSKDSCLISYAGFRQELIRNGNCLREMLLSSWIFVAEVQQSCILADTKWAFDNWWLRNHCFLEIPLFSTPTPDHCLWNVACANIQIVTPPAMVLQCGWNLLELLTTDTFLTNKCQSFISACSTKKAAVVASPDLSGEFFTGQPQYRLT